MTNIYSDVRWVYFENGKRETFFVASPGERKRIWRKLKKEYRL